MPPITRTHASNVPIVLVPENGGRPLATHACPSVRQAHSRSPRFWSTQCSRGWCLKSLAGRRDGCSSLGINLIHTIRLVISLLAVRLFPVAIHVARFGSAGK